MWKPSSSTFTYGQTDFKHIVAFYIFRKTSHLKILGRSSATLRSVSATALLMNGKSLMFGTQYSSMLIPGHPKRPEYKNKIVAGGVGVMRPKCDEIAAQALSRLCLA